MDEIKIKAVIDAAESAKTVAELKRALKDLRSAALQVEEGSEAFRQITQTAGELQDKIGDLNATTKALGDDLFKLRGFTQIAQGIAGAFSVVQSATALWGVENEAVEKSLLKVQSAMGILNGIMAVGEILQKESTATLLIQNGIRSTAIALTSEQAVAEAAEAVAAGTATIAQRALNAAMNANPILALVSLLALATTALLAFSSSSDDAAKAEKKRADEEKKAAAQRKAQIEEQKKYNKFIGDEASAYLILAEKIKQSIPGSKERLNLINQMNSTYGTTLKNLKDEAKFQEQVSLSVDKYIKFLKFKYQLQREEGFIQDNLAKQQKLRDDIAEKEKLTASIAAKNGLASEAQIKRLRELEKAYFNVSAKDQLAALEKSLKARVDYTIRLENVIEKSNLKMANDRVDKEKKADKKIVENRKGFTLDLEKLNDVIYESGLRLQEAYLDSWEDTYDKKLIANLAAEEAAIKDIKDAYANFLDDQKAAFEDSVNFNVGKLQEGTAEYNQALNSQFQAYIQNQIQQNTEAGKKLLQAKQVEERAITATQRLYVETRTKLLEDEIKRQRDLLLESSQILLSTDEYKRFYQFIDLQQNAVKVKANENIELVKQSMLAEKRSLEESISNYINYAKNIEDAKKKRDEILGKSMPTGEEMEALEKLNLEIELGKGQLDQFAASTAETRKQIDVITGSIKMWDEIAKELNTTTGDFSTDLENFAQLTEIAAASVDKNVGFTESLTQKFRDFTNTLDASRDGLIDYTDTQSDFSKNLSSILNITRETNKGVLGDNVNTNRLLIALYQDKNSAIIDFEDKTNENLQQIIDDRITFEEDAAKKARDAGQKVNEAIINDRVKALKELKGKSFAVQPVDEKQFGLDRLAYLLPEELTKLNNKLTERYDTALSTEQKFYDQSLFNLYKLYQEKKNAQGEDKMTYEEYLKEEEKLRLNHEENMLVIQTTYGKKGQENFVDFAKKRTEKEEQDRLNRVNKTFENIQKIVELEKLASDLIMQEINQRYAAADRASQQRYENTISRIDDEQKAYEDMMDQRSAIEQQQLDIQAEFDQKRKEAEDQRRSEQNALAKKQFEAQKINSTGQVVIDYAVAIGKAFATFGWPAGIFPAALLATQGALQVALIQNQEFVPQYATGGLVTGEGGPTDDKIWAKLSNGESVINAKSTKMFAPVLSAINQAGGGKPIPMLADGGIVNVGGFDHIHTDTMATQTGSYNDTVALDEGTLSALDQIFSKVSVNTNEITNAQSKVAKVERRTKF